MESSSKLASIVVHSENWRDPGEERHDGVDDKLLDDPGEFVDSHCSNHTTECGVIDIMGHVLVQTRVQLCQDYAIKMHHDLMDIRGWNFNCFKPCLLESVKSLSN